MEKDYLPEGITEKQFIDIVYKVSKNSCKKFLFGYHEIEDHQQKAFEIAITILKNGKFKPRGLKPMDVQLENFLRRWIANRLNNYRRDKSCRYPNKGGANQTKYNLMHPIKIHSQNLSDSEIFMRDNNILDIITQKEMIEFLKSNLTKDEYDLYDEYIISGKLNKNDFKKLNIIVKRILKEKYDG